MLQPLEVFALNEERQRATGSIPYISLIWTRRYYKCGEFQIVVPSNIYSPTWALICAVGRNETGIIQKVEFSDTSNVAGGIDTVTLSGFFLESMLNNITFLVEQPEDKTVIDYVVKPKRPGYHKSKQPTIYKDPTGAYYQSDGNGKAISVDDGRVVSTQGLEEVDYKWAWNNGTSPEQDAVDCNFAYYIDEDPDKIHVVGYNRPEREYDIAFKAPNGDYFYWGGTGGNTLTQAVGVVQQGSSVIHEWTWVTNLPSYDDSERIVYKTIKVRGPWQRTNTEEPITETDSVKLVFEWAQRMMGNWIIYEEPEIEGAYKVVDPSFQLLGDLMYSTLQEVEASFRLQYNFLNDSFVLSVWRGEDRTKEYADAQPVQSSMVMPMMLRAAAVDAAIGYTSVSYIGFTGTQYIDIGFKPNNNTRAVIDMYIPEGNGSDYVPVFGTRDAQNIRAFVLWQDANGNARHDYGDANRVSSIPLEGRLTVDVNKNVLTIGDRTDTMSAATFSCSYNMMLGTLTTGASLDDRRAVMDVYSFKVYDNGELVRDMSPVVRDSDSKPGLYDSVNDVFYTNDGTGEFGIPLSPIPAPEPAVLPQGYTPIEYAESNGTQYIDTGYVPNGDTSVWADLMPTSAAEAGDGTGMVAYGAGESYNSRAFELYSVQGSYEFNYGASYTLVGTIAVNERVQVSHMATGAVVEYEGGQYEGSWSQQTFTAPYTMGIFAAHRAQWLRGNQRIYRLRIFESGELVHDYVPAQHENVVGMYDVVEGEWCPPTFGVLIGGDVQPTPDQLTYLPNSLDATGETPPTAGYLYQTVTVSECLFGSQTHNFVSWNTSPDGSGTQYAPGDPYTLTAADDVLYAQWEEIPSPEPPGPEPSEDYPWAVFSDTWGTIYGYTSTYDDSNYRNTCYVLYDYEQPKSFDSSGMPSYEVSYTRGELLTQITGFTVRIPYDKKRSYFIERVGTEDEPDIETYLDLRDEKPSCDGMWSRDSVSKEYDKPLASGDEQLAQDVAEAVSQLYTYDSDEGGMPDMEKVYDSFWEGLQGRGERYLKENYYVVRSLDTGTVDTGGYRKFWDLGDKVDMEVSTVGMVETARITEVEEVYETTGNGVDYSVNITVGNEQLNQIKRAQLK